MKHVLPNQVSKEARAGGPTRRTLAKQQTRLKVLAAARKLFGEKGYQNATIRDIAAAAGMSTGAVFANFDDKAHLFREVVGTDTEQVASEMRVAAGRGKAVDDALLRIFMAGYSFYRHQMPLARAGLVASLSSDEEGQALRELEQLQVLPTLIADQLNAAAERGELKKDADVKLRAQMLFDIYLCNFKPAMFDRWSLDELKRRSKDQIRVLLDGAR
jgi:AcrR family transcriptional regulator